MGILPLQFKAGESADAHGLDGTEAFSIDLKGGAL
jgi:aconitase A